MRNLYNADTIPSAQRGVSTAEASGIFLVGVAMHSRAVEHYEGTSRALCCCSLARKTNGKVILCVLVLLYCPVVELISCTGQLCARGMQAFALLSKSCEVQ